MKDLETYEPRYSHGAQDTGGSQYRDLTMMIGDITPPR
jgi:hypothetical protein